MLALLAILLTSAIGARAARARQPAEGHVWYVDCSAPIAGDGTGERPFNSLAAANELRLAPGDRLRLEWRPSTTRRWPGGPRLTLELC